jgi:hypothetical protein
MSKFGIIGATALSLALAVATPAFAVGLHDVGRGGAMHVRGGGFRGAQASVGSRGAHINGVGVGHIGEIGDPRLYPYDPDCNDFFFRHPDYQWQPSCN